MAITITSIKFSDEYTGIFSGNGSDQGMSNLKGCVGDLIWMKAEFYFQTAALDTPIKFSEVNQTIQRQDCLPTGSFITDGFKVGDTIVVTNSSINNGTYTVTAVTATTITVSSGISSSGTSGSVNIYVNNSLTNSGMDFYYNVLPTGFARNFQSVTDVNSLQKFTCAIPAAYGTTIMNTATRSLAWWNGSAAPDGYYGTNNLLPRITNEGVSADYKFSFTMIFPFLITPFFTADQLQIFQDAFTNSKLGGTENVDISDAGFTVPDYFKDGGTLDFLYQIDVRYTAISDVTPQQTSGTLLINGNVAWFNDLFPFGNTQAGVQKFYLSHNTAYVVNGNASTGLDYVSNTSVTIKLHDSGFSANDIVLLNFMWLPTNASVYQNTNAQSNKAAFRDVFMHDRCLLKVNGGFDEGDRAGSTYQAITQARAFISGTDLVITFTCAFGTEIKSVLSSVEDSDRNYLLWVTPQYQAITTLAAANRNSVMADVNVAVTDTDDSTALIVSTDGTTDIHYFTTDDVTPYTNISAMTGGFIWAKCGFKTNEKPISIRSYFLVNIIDNITLATVDSFVLEDWNKDVRSYWNGTFADIDIQETRGFNLSDTDNRNIRSITRDAALDVGAYYGYQLIYGFQLGYQFWIPVNVTQEFNTYPVSYWPVFTQGGTGGGTVIPSANTAQIYHVIEWQTEDQSTGVITTTTQRALINAYDQYNGGLPTATLTTYDEFGNNLSGVISATGPTTIAVMFKGNGTVIAAQAPYTTAIAILTVYYEDGTSQTYDWSDSAGNTGPVTLWTTTPVVTTLTNFFVYAYGEIDLSQAPTPITITRAIVTLTYKV